MFVESSDLESAGELLRQYEQTRYRRQNQIDASPPVQAECEECGSASEFPASQDGTTQVCPKCNAYIDVGAIGWPDDFDFGSNEEPQPKQSDPVAELDAAAKMDKLGDWVDAISAYRDVAEKWPEHANYAENCISEIQRKIDIANDK